MEERGDNKDALLEKLDNLMRSGRSPKHRDPPPLLTEPIRKPTEGTIPTLTDVVSAPDIIPGRDLPANAGGAIPEADPEAHEDPSIDLEPAPSNQTDRNAPLEFERIAIAANPQKSTDYAPRPAPAAVQEALPEDSEQGETDVDDAPAPTVLHESISERLLGVLDREMSSLLKELPSEKGKLSVLHRSLRFALPELVRLRWLEPPSDSFDEDRGAGGSEP